MCIYVDGLVYVYLNVSMYIFVYCVGFDRYLSAFSQIYLEENSRRRRKSTFTKAFNA